MNPRLGDHGFEWGAGVALKQDGGRTLLVLAWEGAAEDSGNREGVIGGSFAPISEEEGELVGGLVVEEEIGVEAFDPGAGDGAEPVGVGLGFLEELDDFWRDPRAREGGRHDGETSGRGRRIAGRVQFN